MKKKLSTGLSLVILGVLCIIFKKDLIQYLISAIGLLTIVFGIIDLTKNKINNGVIQIVIGVLIIVFGWFILEACLLVFGAILLVYSVRKLIFSFKLTEHVDGLYKKMQLIGYPLLTVILGILLIISRWAFVDVVFIIIGVITMLNGLAILISKES